MHTLTAQQKYAAARWIDRNEEMLISSSVSYKDAAVMASKALGFDMTWSNIRGAAVMSGTKWTGGKGGSKGSGKVSKRVQIVAEELIRVMHGLGIEPTEELEEIAKGGK